MQQPIAVYNGTLQSHATKQTTASQSNVSYLGAGDYSIVNTAGTSAYCNAATSYAVSCLGKTEFSDASDQTLGTSVQSAPTQDPPELQHEGAELKEEEEPVIDIIINNVVCTFNTKCHLNLKRIAMEGMNVIFKRENGMVSMKIRHPSVTASIWSSGKVTTTGSNSEESARQACRKVARCLQRLGFRARFTTFRVVNVLGTCVFPFGIHVPQFSQAHADSTCYEPELHPGATYRIPTPRATLKIFSTGSVTVTAPSVTNVQAAIEHIYPLVYEFRADRSVAQQDVDPLQENTAMPLVEKRTNRSARKRRRYDGGEGGSDSWSDESAD